MDPVTEFIPPEVAGVPEDDVPVEEPGASMEMVLIPRTGEVIDPRDTAACVNALDDLRRLGFEIAAAKRALSQAVAEHRQLVGKNTFTVGGRAVEVKGGEKKTIDPLILGRGLREAGMPEERVDDIVQPSVTFKVDARAAQQAGKTNPKYQAALDRATTTEEAPWTITIKR